MKHKGVFCTLLLLGLGVLFTLPAIPTIRAAAQDESTPTITAPAFYSGVTTNTPQPTFSDYSCHGVPAGLGTVTPDPLWLMMCGQCMGGMTSTEIAATESTIMPTSCATIVVEGTPGFDCGLSTATSAPTIAPTCAVANITPLATVTAYPVTSTSIPASSVLVEAGSSAITKSGFISACSGCMSGNDIEYASANGSTSTLNLTGSSVTVYYYACTQQGTMTVSIDGSVVATLNEDNPSYSCASYSSAGFQSLVWSGSVSSGSHTVVLTKTSGLYAVFGAIGYTSLPVVPTAYPTAGTSYLTGGSIVFGGPWGPYTTYSLISQTVEPSSGQTLVFNAAGSSTTNNNTFGSEGTYHSYFYVEPASCPETVRVFYAWTGTSGGVYNTDGSTGYVDENVPCGGGEYDFQVLYSYAASAPSTYYTDYSLTVSLAPVCPSNGTPSPSGGSSFCSSVNGGEVLDTGFGYSGLIYGATACFDIGPMDWSTVLPSWLGGDNLPAIPWIAHLCAQDLNIGTVEVFGYNVSLQVLAYVLAVVSIVIIAVTK